MEWESEKQLKDFHQHQPLVLNEEPWDESSEIYCPACKDPLSGQSYSCADAECNFHLHKRCAEASKVYDLPVNRGRFRLILTSGGLCGCFFCRVSMSDFFYRYDGPGNGFQLCMKCVFFMLNNNENNEELELDYDDHPLLVVANHKDELKRIKCDLCQEALLDSICVCYKCRLFLHKKCTADQLPLEINHPCHRRHHLFLCLRKKASASCEICKRKILGLCYECLSCYFWIHHECALLGSFSDIADETHQHTFNLVWRRVNPFICEACGTEGQYASYVCSTCHIILHKECTSLPPLIRITRHYDHPISHNYFVEENFDFLDQKHPCRICYDEVEKEYGCYSCSKEDCNYIVHVNCAIVEGNYWIVSKDEPEDSVVESFRIIERHYLKGPVKIEHFSHDHYLILGDEIKEGDDKCCDGCMLFLSGLFYYCSQCDFFLHKTCAELPREKNLWFHQHRTTLELASTSLLGEKRANQVQASFLQCKFCYHWAGQWLILLLL